MDKNGVFDPVCPDCGGKNFLSYEITSASSPNHGRSFLKCADPECPKIGFVAFADGKPSKKLPEGGVRWSATGTPQ